MGLHDLAPGFDFEFGHDDGFEAAVEALVEHGCEAVDVEEGEDWEC